MSFLINVEAHKISHCQMFIVAKAVSLLAVTSERDNITKLFFADICSYFLCIQPTLPRLASSDFKKMLLF